ncbi:MAG: hypothetical protein HWD85_00895 [Flavobacteriaceae bacterium]|nr:hypothetical protein [Flavobacteriaceae bacterium]
MYNNNFVEFKKERDLGAIISDTFKFLRLEWKPFFGAILKTAFLPIILAIAALFFYTFSFPNIFGTNIDIYEDGIYQEPNLGLLFTSIFAVCVFFLIAYVIMNITALYYIKSYVDNNGKVDFEMIKERVKDKFWSFTGLFILVGIIVVISALLCFFPAIYTGVVLSLAAPILVYHNMGVSDTVSYSFSFVKGHWWETFGVMFVVGIITTVAGYIFSIPAMIYFFIKMGTIISANDPAILAESLVDPIYLILNGISYIGQFILYGVTLVSSVLIYFDINEQKNASGAIDKINSLGN